MHLSDGIVEFGVWGCGAVSDLRFGDLGLGTGGLGPFRV